jgi:hypothetical protein
MRRRQFVLGTIPSTLALTGCSTGYGGPIRPDYEGTPSSPPTASPTGTPNPTPEGFWRVVSLDRTGPVADRHEASMTATLEEPWVTAEGTARIAVTLTNRAAHARTFFNFDDPEVKRGFFTDRGILLGALRGASTHPPRCIGTDGKRPGPFGESGEGAWQRELQSNESVTVVFGVVDDPRVLGCISPGTYRFVWPLTYEVVEEAERRYPPFRWGLTLKVTAPSD